MDLVRTLRWPVALVVVAVLAFLGSERVCRTVEGAQQTPERAIERVAEVAQGIAERFRSGQITTTFMAALPRLVPDGGPHLGLVAVESIETFTRRDERRVMFGLVSLGATEMEIRAPVTYRYHVMFDEPWQIDVEDQHCIVRAPALRPTQPPAIHTDRLERRSTRGWARFDTREQMEMLERSMTPTLRQRAEDPDTIELLREPARLRVAEFVRNWLLSEDHWREDRFHSITVVFADEDEPSLDASGATISLDRSRDDRHAAADQLD